MSEMIRQVIWDIDGTLLHTHAGLVAAVAHTLQRLGRPAPAEVVEQLVRLPKITQSLMEVVGMDRAAAEEATDLFRQRYLEQDMYLAEPFAGIPELLEYWRARGVRQAIATNKRQDCAEALCAHFGISAFCSPIMGADRYNSLSKKDRIEACMRQTGSRASETLYIGDVEADQQASEELGIHFLGVNYGYGFRQVPGFADSPREILPLLAARALFS